MATLPVPQPDPRIAEYIKEISRPGIPYVSTSHIILFNLGHTHGAALVNSLIDDYFADMRKYREDFAALPKQCRCEDEPDDNVCRQPCKCGFGQCAKGLIY